MLRNQTMPKGSRVAIVGMDEFAQKIASVIVTHGAYKLVAFVGDQDCRLSSAPTISFNDARSQMGVSFDIVISVEEMPYTDEKYYRMHEVGFSDIYVLHKENRRYFEANGEFVQNVLQRFNLEEKPLLRYIETHLVDNCNLNCKGCTHFANLYAPNSDVPIDVFAADINQISKHFNVSVLRLMGGEPLLNKNLSEIVVLAREAFANSKISIVTNGLLVPQLSEGTCSILRQKDVALNITVYQPTAGQIQKIESFLRKHGIEHYYNAGNASFDDNMTISHFHKCLQSADHPNDGSAAYSCFNRYCWFLRNGRLSKCAFPQLISVVEQKLSGKFLQHPDDVIDIFQIKNGWDVVKKLNEPMFFCRNCSSVTEKYEWFGNYEKPDINDYCILGSS